MLIKKCKQKIRFFITLYDEFQNKNYILKRKKTKPSVTLDNFCFESFKTQILDYLSEVRSNDNAPMFFYSKDSSQETLYASVYGCMTLSLLGELKDYTEQNKREWADLFDSFQNPDDGLFYDSVVLNECYLDSDWWGARHLAVHMISAYSDLGLNPKYQFSFLEKFYDLEYLKSWLNSIDWESETIGLGDVDNRIMNIGCLLQYQRDKWVDQRAGVAVDFLKNYLKRKVNPKSGLWGKFDVNIPSQRSRMIQFAYHLLTIFFYDEDYTFDYEAIVENVLQSQNVFGGYGVKLNSSACEDIDSIDLLIRFYPKLSKISKQKVDRSLIKAFEWVMLNQSDDNGFVFRLNESFEYGSRQTYSSRNVGAMLPTWFRTLSIVYIVNHFNIDNKFQITRCPGYEF